MSEPTAPNRVLVVDDEETIRHVLRQVLEEQGCEVLDAGSAEEGLALVDGCAVDVAMLDIVLPGMSGIELLQSIESISPQTQVIMMTSHASLETTLEAIRHGAYAYLQKPFDELDQVWATVSRAFEKRRLMELLERRSFELMKAAEANRAKSQFLANVSHELRTPLNVILGFCELLRKNARTVTPEKLEIDLRKISWAGGCLLRQITDILDVSRIESGDFQILHSDFDLGTLAEEIRERFSEPTRAKGLQLDVTIESDVPRHLVGDAERVGQVLDKIVDNAIKFTKSGAIAVQVSHGESRGDLSEIRFEVQDTGIGVPEERREQIFELFTQEDASSSRRYQGAGLGLGIAKRLVEAMGGTIGVRSNQGQGSTFWFAVPLAQTAATARTRSVPA